MEQGVKEFLFIYLAQNPTLLIKQVEPSGTKKKKKKTPSVSAAHGRKLSVLLPSPSEGKKEINN